MRNSNTPAHFVIESQLTGDQSTFGMLDVAQGLDDAEILTIEHLNLGIEGLNPHIEGLNGFKLRLSIWQASKGANNGTFKH